jgi:hypothetical protein
MENVEDIELAEARGRETSGGEKEFVLLPWFVVRDLPFCCCFCFVWRNFGECTWLSLCPWVLQPWVQPSADPKYLKKKSCICIKHIQTFFLSLSPK